MARTEERSPSWPMHRVEKRTRPPMARCDERFYSAAFGRLAEKEVNLGLHAHAKDAF